MSKLATGAEKVAVTSSPLAAAPDPELGREAIRARASRSSCSAAGVKSTVSVSGSKSGLFARRRAGRRRLGFSILWRAPRAPTRSYIYYATDTVPRSLPARLRPWWGFGDRGAVSLTARPMQPIGSSRLVSSAVLCCGHRPLAIGSRAAGSTSTGQGLPPTVADTILPACARGVRNRTRSPPGGVAGTSPPGSVPFPFAVVAVPRES